MFGFKEEKLKPAEVEVYEASRRDLQHREFCFTAIPDLCPLYIGRFNVLFTKCNQEVTGRTKQVKGYSLGQHAHFVLVLLVISELDLDLESSKLDGILQPDRMRPFQNCLLCLFIQQVELDRIPEIINNKFVIS